MNIEIQVSALSKPLSEQLKGKVTASAGHRLDTLADAYIKLKVHRLLTSGECAKVFARLVQKVKTEIKEKAKA